MKHRLNTDLFRGGGCPSSVVALLRRVEASAPAPASAKPADRGGNSALTPALSPRRGGCRSRRPAIVLLRLPFWLVPAPMVATGRVRSQEIAAEQARRWGRTIRPRLPFLPLLGERAGVRAEFPSSLPSTSRTSGNGMTPVPIRLPLLGERAGVRAELSTRLPHLRPLLLSVFHPCSIRGSKIRNPQSASNL